MTGLLKATAIGGFAIVTSVGAAFATDVSKGSAMQPEPFIAAPPAAAPATTFWNGAYVGGMLGMGSANYKFSGSITDPDGGTFLSAGLPDFGGMGPLLGVQAGYNWRFAPEWVLGVQLDGSLTNIKHSANLNIPDVLSANYDLKLRNEIALTARAGYVVEERTMLYGLIGASRARFEGNLNATDGGGGTFSTDYSFNRTGWTVGLGIATMLTDNVSVGLEYRYTDYGRETLFNGPLGQGVNADFGFDTKVQSARVGVNYHF